VFFKGDMWGRLRCQYVCVCVCVCVCVLFERQADVTDGNRTFSGSDSDCIA